MPSGWLGKLAEWATGRRSPPTSRAERADAQKALTEEVAAGYRPRMSMSGQGDGSADLPSMQQVIWDIEGMLAHARVHISMDYYRSGTAKAEIEVEGSSADVEKFALNMHQRFQARSHQDASRACDYGRGGYETLYDVEDGLLTYQGIRPFFPLDCDVLTVKKEYAGIRLREGSNEGAQDLWGPTPSGIPPKAFWHAHNRRYNRWYGVPQPYPAWRSWRRLAGRDGAEEVTDGGIYRFAYQGPLVRYPLEDLEPQSNYGQNNPATGKITNRDKAREFAENAKAGASVALSSRRDPESGQYAWEIEWPDKTLVVDGLLAYEGSLEKGISLGIGVPPELIEASEVGSGWSGRAIPMVAFYTGQQARASNLHEDYRLQIGLPLVQWNFGPGAWYRVKVKDLLKTMMGLAQPVGPGPTAQPPTLMSTVRFATQEEWTRYQGPSGGAGWKNAQTGEVRYQETKPGSEGESEEKGRPKDAAAIVYGLHQVLDSRQQIQQGAQAAKQRLGGSFWTGMSGKVKRSAAAVFAASKYIVQSALYINDSTQRWGLQLAKEAAKERGLSDKHVERVGKIVNLVDQMMTLPGLAKGAKYLSAAHAGAGEALGQFGGYTAGYESLAKHFLPALGPSLSGRIPFASLAYVGYSGVRNPLAVMRAARNVVRDNLKGGRDWLKRVTGKKTQLATAGPRERSSHPDQGSELRSRHQLTQEQAGRLAAAFEDAKNADWLEALFMVAWDETGDFDEALALATHSAEKSRPPEE